ncbi:MAG TPA: histidine kinase N-terminal 7TM domain-containing protein [Anaerolineaceae bacterium]|nr:histidine kinase N-terminal 7TM domain-containing protein [Anaerolineaceae bacterium]
MNIDLLFSSHILSSIVAILIVAGLVAYSFRQRDVPGAMAFSVACALGLLWLLGMIFEDITPAIDAKIFWRKFQTVWQLPSATAVTVFLLEYAKPRRWSTRRNLVLLSIPPILMAVLILTNEYHHQFWESFFFDDTLVAVPGPLLRYFVAYVYINFLLNLVTLVWIFIHSPQNRWPVAFIIIGQVIMRFMYFFELSNQAGSDIPLSALGITFISIVYAIVLFRFRIFGPLSRARQVLHETIPIGIVILDEKERIRSLNPAAEVIIEASNRTAKGKLIRELLLAYPRELPEGVPDQQVEFSQKLDQRTQFFEMDISNLRNWRGAIIGKLLLITDVTEQRKVQQQFLDQQRVLATLNEREQLAREMHDDFAQVLSFMNTQCQTICRLLKKGDTDQAANYLEKLVEVAKSVDVDIRDSIQGMRATILEDGLLLTLEKYLTRFERDYAIRTEIINSKIIREKSLSPMVEIELFRIIQETLTNVRKHANATRIKINFESVDGFLSTCVEDNGYGFDLEKHRSMQGNHFGLQMMRERAEVVGGSVQMDSQKGQGTRVRIMVPAMKEEVA